MLNRNLNDLDPRLKPMVEELLKININGYYPFLVEGFRSNKRQSELYAKGRSAPGRIITYAKAGGSDHNYGRAIDIAFKKKYDWRLSWSKDLYKGLVPYAKKLGFKWGGDWVKFSDMPHFYIEKDYKKEDVSNTKIVQDEDSSGIYIAVLQTSPEALYSNMISHGLVPPMKNNKPNIIDFDRLEIDGTIKLNK